ncbi:hypothetical protein OIV83_005703 [Microbotryomycetes sp. JL201]|nr:hypothetical protein OIV83_005703 [Microbotryomycetes sp. JL201]
MSHLAVARAEFAYEATTEDELTIEEEQLVWVLENDDADWHKVKIKSADPAIPGASGLVPASYLAPATPLRTVTALYDYTPAVTETGELENDEELEIREGEQLELIEEETDWCLVQRPNAQGAGFVPTTYIESADAEAAAEAHHDAGQAEESDEEPAADYAESVPVAATATASRTPASAGNVKTWAVTEIDKKKKKKKGTLGIGNGAVFFASESDKTPVQQYPLAELTDITHEKSKHLHLTFPSAGELHFVIGSKDAFDEIMDKLDQDRATTTPSPVASVPTLPLAPAAPPAPPAPVTSAVPSATYIPPPPPIRTSSSNAIAPPPIRTASSSAPRTNGSSAVQTNAVALYDFESQGDDELSLAEGQRVLYLDGASDDPEWAKVRKVDTGEEGVVPMSYIEIDDGPAVPAAAAANDVQDDEEEARRLEEERAAADEAALAAQLKADARAQRERDARAAEERDARRREKSDAARSNRLSQAPKVAPIPVPQSADDDDEPPQLAPRPTREREKKAVRKPDAKKIRTWKDRTGQFKVDAEFLGFKDNKIRLHKLNGVIIEVPIEKMSNEDTAYLKRIMGGSSSRDEGSRSDRDKDRERRRKTSRAPSEEPASRESSSRTTQPATTSSSSAPRKSKYDWFEFFLAAGCDPHHIDRYARNADNEGLDESSIPDLEDSNLRSLGLKEGDVIRTKKYIREKFGNPPPPTPEKSERDAQITADALLAKALQNGTPVPPAPNLFSSGPDGALKPRRGRRNTATSGQSSAVDSNAIASAGEALSKVQVSSTPRVASPVTSTSSEANRSRANTQTSGFDDDAWEVKPSAKSEPTPAPRAPSPPAAPPAPAPASSTATASAPQAPTRSGSAGPSTSNSSSTLTYNDGLLAQLGIHDRPPSAPASSSAGSMQAATATGSSFSQPSNGPRGPVLPVPSNQGLLAPMVPTPTGFNARLNPMMPMATGFPAMGMQPAFTGMPMMSQPTGFAPMSAPMGMQPTGAPSFMQPQATGFSAPMMQPQMTGMMAPSPQPSVFGSQSTTFNPAPARFSPAPSMQQQQQQGPIQFNPMPPTSQPQPQQSTATGSSSSSSDFAPSNIFSSMKSGTFASGGRQLGPQDASKYDALRPQVTGMPSSFGGPMQPQQTGFGMQSQMTGFGASQPQQQQYTGMPQYGQQNGFRQF